jgi:hypothetical protein
MIDQRLGFLKRFLTTPIVEPFNNQEHFNAIIMKLYEEYTSKPTNEVVCSDQVYTAFLQQLNNLPAKTPTRISQCDPKEKIFWEFLFSLYEKSTSPAEKLDKVASKLLWNYLTTACLDLIVQSVTDDVDRNNNKLRTKTYNYLAPRFSRQPKNNFIQTKPTPQIINSMYLAVIHNNFTGDAILSIPYQDGKYDRAEFVDLDLKGVRNLDSIEIYETSEKPVRREIAHGNQVYEVLTINGTTIFDVIMLSGVELSTLKWSERLQCAEQLPHTRITVRPTTLDELKLIVKERPTQQFYTRSRGFGYKCSFVKKAATKRPSSEQLP